MPVLFFNYVGFELPNAAGDEMKDPQKDVPFTVLRSAFGTVAALRHPDPRDPARAAAAQVTSLGGFIDAMKTVFTVYGGHVETAKDGTVTATLTGAGKVLGDLAAIGFILALLSSGTTWIMGADRSQAVAGFDGAAPRSFGVLLLALGHAGHRQPALGRLLDDRDGARLPAHPATPNKYFTAVLGLAISTTTISYLVDLPRRDQAALHARPRPAAVPRARAARRARGSCGVLCTAWATLATVALLYPGFGTSAPGPVAAGRLGGPARRRTRCRSSSRWRCWSGSG